MSLHAAYRLDVLSHVLGVLAGLVAAFLLVGCRSGGRPIPAALGRATARIETPTASSLEKMTPMVVVGPTQHPSVPLVNSSETTRAKSASGDADSTSLGKNPFPSASDLSGALPGGGTVHDGPFVFYATLYRDPAMQLPGGASSPAETSDVPGAGVRLVWRYDGPGMDGPIQEAWGPEGRMQNVAGYTMLSPGERGGRNGGGLLVSGSGKAGAKNWFGLRLTTPTNSYGIKLQYSLQAGTQSPMPTEVTVVAFNQ